MGIWQVNHRVGLALVLLPALPGQSGETRVRSDRLRETKHNRARRPIFVIGGYIPLGDRGYFQPVPLGLLGYLAPPPPGYSVGYFDGGCGVRPDIVRDPEPGQSAGLAWQAFFPACQGNEDHEFECW